jgi:hypothetical protein
LPAGAQQKEFGWLLGDWKMRGKSKFETWKMSADQKFLQGRSFKVTGTDTLVTYFFEKIK